MPSNEPIAQVPFLQEVEKLKDVCRANKTIDGRLENSAEHSWSVSLMAVLLSGYCETQTDMLRVVKMLLIHDIVEIDAGDTWLYSPDQSLKAQKEADAAQRIYSLLPSGQAEEYIGLWREFEERVSEEAKFAAVIDGLQPLLNHAMTGDPKDGTIPTELVREKKAYIQDFAPKLWSMAESLIDEGEDSGLYTKPEDGETGRVSEG